MLRGIENRKTVDEKNASVGSMSQSSLNEYPKTT
jgi:hypothetical protein